MSACEVAFGAACGAACSNDQPCAVGLHCENATCTEECIQSTDCKEGKCSNDGRCVVEDKFNLDPTKTDPTDPTDPPVCVEGKVEFKAVVPQVWLLLDRSGSMGDSLGTTSRWTALGNVLFGDPAVATDRGVVGTFSDRVAFGAIFYTSGSATTGCILNLESVALAANNYSHIRQRYAKLMPSGGTPTADSIAATVAVAASSDLTGGPKLLVLATDGAPGDCAPRSSTATVEVEKEVMLAFNKNIKTFAISIANGTDVPHMQRVANLGLGLPADSTTPAPLYTATSQDDLGLAFSTILTGLPRSCVFSLNGTVKAENADQGTVVFDGQTLTYMDPNGWILKKPDQVELVGEACAQIQAGKDSLAINFPCSVFTPVVK
ncbi:MAG TPA: vWA domain-containing protein [Polyangiaceae bacterium]